MPESEPTVAGWPRVFRWWPAPSQNESTEWYRFTLPLNEYSRCGGRHSRGDALTPESLSSADVIVGGYRGVTLEYCTRWLELCERAEKRMVFDIDDDLFGAPSHFDYASLPKRLAEWESMIRASHVVTVTTPSLAERLSPWNSNVHVVPNRVPSWLTDWVRPQVRLTVGWAGGETHEWDWEDVAPRVGRFLTRNQDVNFHAMGSFNVINMRGWPDSRVRTSAWCGDPEEYYRSIDFDIGVIPLRVHMFNKSKSAIKALEYAALGVPAVASSYGPYETFVQHGETGYLVRYDHEWESYLRDLAGDPTMRVEMGEAGRQLARAHTVEGNLESWLVAWMQ